VSAFGGIVAFNIEVDEVSCVYRFQVRHWMLKNSSSDEFLTSVWSLIKL
jgi:hypothetical protein